MNAHDVRTLFAYNSWANRWLLEATARLTPDEFTRDLGASFGSVRGTLVHILCGERRWLRFWVDGSQIPEPTSEELFDVAAFRESWSTLDRDRQAFAAVLTDAQLEIRHTVRGKDFTLGELIHHISNHSTYHRGQVVLLLRQLGHTPPPTDYRLYLSESR